jgi:hypothetical protein
LSESREIMSIPHPKEFENYFDVWDSNINESRDLNIPGFLFKHFVK